MLDTTKIIFVISTLTGEYLPGSETCLVPIILLLSFRSVKNLSRLLIKPIRRFSSEEEANLSQIVARAKISSLRLLFDVERNVNVHTSRENSPFRAINVNPKQKEKNTRNNFSFHFSFPNLFLSCYASKKIESPIVKNTDPFRYFHDFRAAGN